MIERQSLDLKTRHDLRMFIHRTFLTVAPGQTFSDKWHIDAMAHLLERCASGDVKRGLITLPPRHLKPGLPFSKWTSKLIRCLESLDRRWFGRDWGSAEEGRRWVRRKNGRFSSHSIAP
jgi:hypothetical protein